MIKTTHLRAPLPYVLAIVDEALAEEGFRRADVVLTPERMDLGNGETLELPPRVDPTMRRVMIAEKDGWVTIGDDPFASTCWGEVLSAGAPGTPVFTLEGERDHAFYSTVSVHEGGTENHTSSVPGDAVAGSDGRHRIHPRFLAAFFPDRASALEEGIVVHRLGGEENVRAVAEVLGLPNALLGPDDHAAAGVTTRIFTYDESAAPALGASASPFGGLLEGLAKQLGVEAELSSLMPTLTKSFVPGVHVDAPLTLEAPSTSRDAGFVGDDHRFHTTFELHGGNGERAEGLTVRVSGASLAFFDVHSISIVTPSTLDRVDAEARVPERVGDELVVTVPSFVLTAPVPDAASVPAGERMRRFIHTPHRFDSPAKAIVYVSGRLRHAGTGDLVLRAETTVNGAVLSATTDGNALTARPAPRTPVLPPWVTAAALANERHALEEYAGRDHASGWLGFDRAWSEVGEVVVRMAQDLTALLLEIERSEPRRERVVLRSLDDAALAALRRGADVIVEGPPRMRATLSEDGDVCLSSIEDEPPPGFRAEVLRKGGERLDFADVPWGKLLPELERGADVALVSGPYRSETRIELVHQPEGSNYFPDPARAEDHVRVQFAWTCPRPEASGSRVSLGRAALDLLTRAGAMAGQLGGVAYAAGSPIRHPGFELPYMTIVGTRRSANEPSWLRTHVKGPGYQVLVPEAVDVPAGTAGIVRARLAHGVLLSSPAADPFAYDDRDAEAMERAVASMVGEPGPVAPG